VTVFDVLVVAWWTCALGGVAALAVAVSMASRRRQALGTAAVLLAAAGVLGLASVGIIFLVAATFCAFAALRARTA
jgi:hypothetical protein